MILRKCDMKTFSERCSGKKLACYGIGGEFDRIIKNYKGYKWEAALTYLVDGNADRRGNKKIVNETEYEMVSLDDFVKMDLSDVILLITCTAYAEVVERLEQIAALDSLECYLFHFMFGLSEGEKITIRHADRALIPPVIHYCWFGGKELPDLYKKCIDSWHRFCPDYEIKEWNETNCDVSETLFTKQAYEVGKYGFVPDYFRLKIIYENGGIYLDTDVEVLKNLDELRYNSAFCGMEFPGEVNLGLGFGAEKEYPVMKELIKRYRQMPFIYEDGTYNEVISPIYQTKDLMEMGMQYGTGLQKLDGLTIYPVEVLSPKNINTGEYSVTDYSYALHHYDGSWVNGKRLEEKIKRAERVAKLQEMFQ